MSSLTQELLPRLWRSGMRWIFRVGVLIWLFGAILAPVWGLLSPSEAHISGLRSFTSEPAILIGASETQRGYLTFPSSLFPGDAIFVDVDRDGRVEIHQAHHVVYLMLVLYFAAVVYTCVWVRRVRGAA
jgi:hypothetical protein